MNIVAVLIACGREEQLAPGRETAFLPLGNRPVIAHALDVLQATDAVDSIVVAVAKDRVDSVVQMIRRFGYTKICGIVVGGSGRLSTLKTVISKLPEPADLIVVQEASRPFITRSVVEEVVKSARRNGCAIAAHRLPDAVKVAGKGAPKAEKTLERNSAWAAQSPQAFQFEVLQKILEQKNLKVIDDESEWVRKSTTVRLIEAGEENMKIRSRKDLERATALYSFIKR